MTIKSAANGIAFFSFFLLPAPEAMRTAAKAIPKVRACQKCGRDAEED